MRPPKRTGQPEVRAGMEYTNPDDRRPVIATLDGRLDASTAHD